MNHTPTKKQNPIVALAIIFLAIPLIPFVFIPLGQTLWGTIGVNIPYGEGEKSIKIIKVAKRGLFWKTYELEGVLTQGNFGMTRMWDFSIDNKNPDKEKILQSLTQAFESGQTVKIKYEEKAGTVPWRGGTCFFAKEIQP